MADQETNEGRPAFARVGTDQRDTAELRQETPRWVLDVLDACSIASGETRTAYINRLLEKEVRAELHKFSLVQRVAGRNPIVSELVGGPAR